jgi:hypothetical protein
MTIRNKIFITFFLLLFSSLLFAQQPSHNPATVIKPDTRHIRIVDTLSEPEKTTRNPVLLKTELDSLIKEFNASQNQPIIKEPVKVDKNNIDRIILAGLITIIGMLGLLVYLFYRSQIKMNRRIAQLNEKQIQGESNAGNKNLSIAKEKSNKTKNSPQLLESKIHVLNEELYKLSKENEGMNRVIKEYNGIQHEYDSLRQGILKTYKVKNYPGYDKSKDESSAVQEVVRTENLLANYAYEKFMKPILAITDSNKNNPAKINAADREKLLDLLVSLSLMYIEYLYLRINDLSIGGKIAERIQGLSKGKAPDIALLKKLNTEFGSRALVLRMALSKADLHELSYPVFDETNLNIL